MNLYLNRYPGRVGHICSGTNVEVLDVDGSIVGYVTPAVADWLVRNGTAMDLTNDPDGEPND